MSNDAAMPAKQESCEDRIGEHLAARLKDLEYLYGSPDLSDADVLREIEAEFGFDPEDDIQEKLYEARSEYGLCFDYCPPDEDPAEDEDPGYFRYQLSWGGPADEFRFFCGPGFSPYRVEYWFLDWFDGAHRALHGPEKALLMSVFEFFEGCGSVEHAYQEATD